MGKGKRRLLAGMLVLSLLVGNIACTEIDAQAAPLETEQRDLAIEDKSGTDVLKSEMLEDGTESLAQEGEDDKEDTKNTEEVNRKEESDETDEENAAIENSDNTNKSEGANDDLDSLDETVDEINSSNDGMNAAEDVSDAELALVTDNDYIAHGTQGNVSWVIDKNGKLTVEGSGDFCELYAPWYSERDSIISANINLTDTTYAAYMFYDCKNLTSIDLSEFDTGKVTDMKFMFAGCGNLKNLDVSNFDTSKVTNMAGMFSGCSGLENLNVSNFDTSNVTEMGEEFSGYKYLLGMFSGCSSLKSLDLSNFNTSKVTNMACMFSGCSSLKSLDLSNFDTENVIYMGVSSGPEFGMFGNCSELTSLDLSNFNAAKVISLSNMFNGCSNLTDLDLSSFNTSNVEDMQDMFSGCQNLTELDLSKFDAGRLIYASWCFKGCEKLSKIYTPYNISVEIDISGTWQDSEGNEYTRSLPQNLPYSIVITKKTDYITASPYITATKTKTSYACGEALSIDDITVTHYDNNGSASTVTEYSTNADEIDMSVPGTKTLIISYNNLTATIKLTVTSGNKEGLKVEMKYPDKKYIYTGRAIRPEIVVTNNGLLLTEGAEYTVKYSKNINASDSAMITVTGKGNLSGSKSKKFTIEAKRFDNTDVETDDTALKVEGDYVTVTEGAKMAPVLFYGDTKLNTKDFKVEDEYKTYKWKAADDGTVIKVTGSGNFTGERTLRVKVITKDKQNQNKLTVSLSNDAKKLIYNGQVQNIKEMGFLTIATSSMQGGLKEGEDYIIYHSDDIKNAGTKKFTVVGISDRCVGTVTKFYTIKPKKTELTVEFDKDSSGYAYVSTGTTIDDLIVKDGSVILAQGSDYKVSYSGNKKAGTAKFTVTGLGNYKGSRYKGSFSINPAVLNNNPAYADGVTEGLEITVGDKVFKKPGVYKSAPYVSINGIPVKSSDYNVTYYLDNPMSNPDAGLMDNKSNKVTNANGDTTVWVKIEGKSKGNYATNNNMCYAVSSYKVRSKAKSGSYDLSKAKVAFQDKEGKSVKKITYTGDPITGDDIKVVVTYKIGRENIALVEGRDYEMEFVNNVNKGKATIVLNGRDGQVKYVGSKTASFSIVANNMKNISKWFGGLF